MLPKGLNSMKKNNNTKFIIVTLLAVILFIVCGFSSYRYTGDCMEPTIANGQLIFMDRISPYLRKYQIGDIILFPYEGKKWVSRIVALANDTIHITEGSILVNGVAVQDGIYRNWSDWKQGTYAIDIPLQIPPDHVFVLSDKLSAPHDDSRVFGPVPKESILGRIL